MNWIKVDAEHMPPDGEPVIVTILLENGNKQVYFDFSYDHSSKGWDIPDCFYQYDRFYCIREHVTHWMPYSAPAQD